MRKDKKVIEHLEGELLKAGRTIGDLLHTKRANEDTIKQLRADLADKDEKYAALLEKYIAMMEKATKLNEQTVETALDDMVVFVLADFEALIYKWMQDNAYDYQLDNGFREIKKKYMGGLGK